MLPPNHINCFVGLLERLFGGNEPRRVPRNWENLPSCTMMLLEDFDSHQIIAAARSSSKDIVCLITAGAAVDPTGFGQIELLYEFADDPSLTVLTWRGMVFVRRSFLASSGLPTPTFSQFVQALRSEAQRQGLRCASQ